MIGDKEKIDILLKEYDHRFEEVKFYSEKYNQQGNYLNILLTLIVAFITAVVSNWEQINKFFGVVKQSQFLLPFILAFVLILTNYFYSLQNDSLAMLFLNGIRISVIEKKINSLVKESLLMWDHSIIPAYHSDKGNTMIGGMVKPTLVSWLWSIAVLICIYTLFVVVCYLFAKGAFWWFVIATLLSGLFHVRQARRLNRQGVQYLVTLVHERSEPPAVTNGGSESNTAGEAEPK